MKTYSNSINRYDEMIYSSRPVKFDEFISDKYNKVHIELFNAALQKYYDSLITNLISKKFMFEFFKLVESIEYDDNFNTYSSNLYERIMSSDNYVKNIIKELSIDGVKFCKYLLKLTNTFIENIKTTIDNNEVLVTLIEELIKATDISDFRIIYYNSSTYLAAEDDSNNFDGEEFLSYIITKETDNDINTYEIIQNNFIKSENDEFVFLLESDSGTRIGYNINGEFIILLDDAKYNDEAFKSFNFFNYMSKTNKNILHLFKEYTLSLYKSNHRVIEIKNTEYWMPSSIVIISNVHPYTKQTISLAKYWNYIQEKDNLNISNIKLTDYQVNDAELLEMNYVRGVAMMRSKLNDMTFEVPFDYLNSSIDVSEEMSMDLIN